MHTAPTRNSTFALAATVAVVISTAMARLPDAFVEQLRRNRPLSSSQAGWAYRLLAFAAVAQALYVGFVILHPERVKRARESDPKLARMSRAEVTKTIARSAAIVSLLTLLYALSAFALTGERGGYWLFALGCLAQLAWYFRQVGEIGRFMGFQPEFVSGSAREIPADEGDDHAAHYSPPLARGVGHTEEDS